MKTSGIGIGSKNKMSNEPFFGQKVIKTGQGWEECPTCHKETKVLIFVEEMDESYCFYCYQNRFGLERLMRKLGDIPNDMGILGFEVREKK